MKKVLFMVVLAGGAAAVFSQQRNNDAYDVIKNNMSVSKFVAGSINEADVEQILAAGIAAPSARNGQPWKFVVVRTAALLPSTINDKTIPNGNIAIIVYTAGDGTNPATILDCGLAVENLHLAAQALGYGSRIYTGTAAAINRAKQDYGIPSNSSAVAVVRVGKITSRADAVSSASTRKSSRDLVIYK
ncbi:MAG: nitroreductase family protein [Spirochaetaceae bacterium]|nr:nitroreductase family protein [Spirochaetaceae bacterium]